MVLSICLDRIAGGQAEILNEYFSIESLERHCYMDLLITRHFCDTRPLNKAHQTTHIPAGVQRPVLDWCCWTSEPNRLHHTSCRQPCALKALGLQRGIPYEISGPSFIG
jgi:hypothetical protein